MLFTNLPLRYIADEPRYTELFLSHGLNPELGLDAMALDRFEPAWHRRTARVFHQAGLTCAVHLPFFDLHPGSLDRLARQACLDRLAQAVDMAGNYEPAHFIAHLDYNPITYAHFETQWLEHAVATWDHLLATSGRTPLYLENVFEQGPGQLRAVLAALGGRARACLDLGHWHCFAGGVVRRNLGEWLQALGPHLGHLHLHDNDGSADQHLGLGLGRIPWDELWDFLATEKAPVGATLEPHTEADFLASRQYLAARPGVFESGSF